MLRTDNNNDILLTYLTIVMLLKCNLHIFFISIEYEGILILFNFSGVGIKY